MEGQKAHTTAVHQERFHRSQGGGDDTKDRRNSQGVQKAYRGQTLRVFISKVPAIGRGGSVAYSSRSDPLPLTTTGWRRRPYHELHYCISKQQRLMFCV